MLTRRGTSFQQASRFPGHDSVPRADAMLEGPAAESERFGTLAPNTKSKYNAETGRYEMTIMSLFTICNEKWTLCPLLFLGLLVGPLSLASAGEDDEMWGAPAPSPSPTAPRSLSKPTGGNSSWAKTSSCISSSRTPGRGRSRPSLAATIADRVATSASRLRRPTKPDTWRKIPIRIRSASADSVVLARSSRARNILNHCP